MRQSTIAAITLSAGFLLGPATSRAQQRNEGQAERGARKPPAEAVAACDGLSEGAACQFEGPRGPLEGRCRIPPRQKVLACVPNDRERRRGGERGEQPHQGADRDQR